MKKVYLLFAVLLVLLRPLVAQTDPPSFNWQKTINGVANSNDNVIKSIRDASGNNYVLVYNDFDIVVVKYDNSGSIINTYKFNNAYNGADMPKDIAVDNMGNIYVGGTSFVNYIWSPSLIKFNAAGGVAFSKIINSVFYTNSVINAVEVDALGNVYFAGAKSDSLFGGYALSDGTIAWESTYVAAGYDDEGELLDMTLDASGNAYTCGRVKNLAGNYDGIITKVNSSGTILWSKFIAGTASGDDLCRKIKTDLSSNAIVISEIANMASTNREIVISKYNASGGFQWQNNQPVVGQVDAEVTDLKLDVAGNAYITSNIYTSIGGNCYGYFLKINPTSDYDYNQIFDFAGTTSDKAVSIVLDNVGDYYIVVNSAFIGYTVRVIKSSGGGAVWTFEYAPVDDNETAASINIDNGNNTYFSVQHGASNRNTSLVRVDQAGNFDWDSVFDEFGNPYDMAYDIFTNVNNSIYTFGSIYNTFTANDVVVTKHDTYGNLMWQYIENSSFDDYPQQFDRDADFNISFLYTRSNQSYLRILDSVGSPKPGIMYDVREFNKYISDGIDFYLAGSAGSFNFNEFPAKRVTYTGSTFTTSYTYVPATATGYKTYLKSMAVDGSNRIYGLGEMIFDEFGPSYKKNIIVQKLNAAGTSLAWKKTISGLDSLTPGNTTQAKRVLVDGSNDVYVLGHSSTSSYTHAFSFLTKLNNTGAVVWRNNNNSGDTYHEYATDMVFSSGSTLLTLTYGTAGLILRRINTSDGTLVWEQIYSIPSASCDGYFLREDAAGDIYILGTAFTTSTRRDLVMVKYNAAGTKLWDFTHSGSLIGDDYPTAMDVTVNNRIYVSGGVVENSGENPDYALMKFCDIAKPNLAYTGSTENICPGNTIPAHVTGEGVSTHLWSPTGQITDSITITSAGNYFCTTTKTDGCSKNTDTIEISYKGIPATPSICLVTVDTASTHNIIYWDKTGITDVSHFVIYREDVTNLYTPVGSVDYDSLSEFHDYGSDPNVTTKRYKLSAVDSCGNESNLSNYHNTLYCTETSPGEFFWNLYDIETEPNPVVNYVIMRQDSTGLPWHDVDTTAGTQQVLNDPSFALFPYGSWRVKTLWGITCTPTRAGVSTSRSNVRTKSMIGQVATQGSMLGVLTYPNPVTNELTVEIKELNSEPTRICVYDATGRMLLEEVMRATKATVNTSQLEHGVYFVEIQNGSQKHLTQVVKI